MKGIKISPYCFSIHFEISANEHETNNTRIQENFHAFFKKTLVIMLKSAVMVSYHFVHL